MEALGALAGWAEEEMVAMEGWAALMEETEVRDDLFNMEDVKVEVMRARGAGGQVSWCIRCVVRLERSL